MKMTPEEISQELTELHESNLKQLYGVIEGHKEYLRGLILEAQEEVRNLAASCDASPDGEEVPAKVVPAAKAVELTSKAVKRRVGVAPEELTAAERPTKRRGRPPKQPVIAEEDEDIQEDQQPAGPHSQQQSVSATVVAAGRETEITAEAADEATSAAEGIRRRPARGRTAASAATSAAAAAIATTRSTRSRRGAAPEPAAAPAAPTSGRGRRGRRGAAATTAPLDAIIEDDEVGQKQQETVGHQQHNDAAAADTIAPLALPCSDLAEPTIGIAEQQQMHGRRQADQTGMKNTDAAIDKFESGGEQQPAAAVEEEAGPSKQGEKAEALVARQCVEEVQPGGSPEPEMQQAAHLSLQRPADAHSPAAAGGDPRTPGFSLAPRPAQKAESDTPCFVGHAPRASTPPQQQQTSPHQGPAGSPAAAAVGHNIPGGELGTAGGEGYLEACGPGSAQQQPATGLKAPSLSFGQPLHAAVLQGAQQEDTDDVAGAVVAEPVVAASADASASAAQAAATCSMDWKSFVSTMHAGDAPTPAVSRQRTRSQLGTGASHQQQQQQQQSGGLGQTTAAAAAAASGCQAPTGAQAEAGTAGLTSRRRTRSLLKQLRSPSLQTLQADGGDLAADGERVDRAISFTPTSNRKSRSVRSPRPSLPRSAKRSTSAMAGTAPEAEAEADLAAEAEGQHVQQEDAAHPEFVEQLQEASVLSQQHTEAAGLCEEHEEAAEAEAGEEVFAEAKNIVQQPAVREAAAAQQEDEDEYFEAEEQDQEVVNTAPEDADPVVASAVSGTDAATSSSGGSTEAAVVAKPSVTVAAASSKAADPVSAWLAATANASAGAAGDKVKQQLEAAKDSKAAAAAAGARPNLVSGIRSFVPAAAKKEGQPIAAGKVKVKVKALEAAEAARKAEDVKAQEKAARQQNKEQQQQQSKARGLAETGAPASSKPQGTPSGAVAHSKVAAVERAAAGLSGSGGAVRVLAQQPEEERHRPADKEAVQKKAEKDAEAAKRAMDKAEREDRMKRAEQKRKDEEQKRRQDLADRQRLKEERAAAAAAALKGGKAVVSKGAGGAQASRAAAADKATDKTKHAAAVASDPSSYKTPAALKAAPRVNTAAAAGASSDTAAASGDSPSLTIKVLEPVSTGNKAKGAMGPPAPVGGKTPAAFKTPAPLVSEQEKRNVEALKSSPYVNTGTKRTPYSQQQQKPDPNSYVISPYRDDDVDTPDRSHKPIPDWARSQQLFEALQTQQHTDPDTIFGARQNTCDLADMFADVPLPQQQQQQQRHRVRKLGQRTSSADWSQDRLTWQEEVKYKKDMGYL